MYTCTICSTTLNYTVLLWIFPLSFFQLSRVTVSSDSWNKQNNDTTVHSFPRLGIHARVIFALLTRFVAPIPHHQTIFTGGLSKQKPPKTFIWASPPACESQSGVRSCVFTAGALINAWLHHLEKLPTSLSAHPVAPQHPGDHYLANTGRTPLFDFSIKPMLWNGVWQMMSLRLTSLTLNHLQKTIMTKENIEEKSFTLWNLVRLIPKIYRVIWKVRGPLLLHKHGGPPEQKT